MSTDSEQPVDVLTTRPNTFLLGPDDRLDEATTLRLQKAVAIARAKINMIKSGRISAEHLGLYEWTVDVTLLRRPVAGEGRCPMRDPDRIPVMLVALGELWVKHPDWRLGQLLLNAANRPDISSLFNMEDDELLRGIVALGERVASPAGSEQEHADEQHDKPDHEAGASDGGEVDRHQDQDEAEQTE